MNIVLKTTVALAACWLAQGASAQITFYENDDFRGRAFSTTRAVPDFRVQGFNDRASSVVVQGGRWEVCQDDRYGSPCVVLRTGSYASLRDMGLNDRLSSTRRADLWRTGVPDAPPPVAGSPYAYRQRPNETLYDAQGDLSPRGDGRACRTLLDQTAGWLRRRSDASVAAACSGP